MARVTKIPATINPLTQAIIGSNVKRKVAAYARVSTDQDEQYSSYEAQVRIYTEMIQKKPEWEFVNVYADEGITGTSTKKRAGFNKMIADAMAGKINLIITKSISRFARNTVDTLKFVRELKSKGVECYFEKENLWSFDSKTEFILTIMASIAQEESRSISQNVTLGKRWAMDAGHVSFAYSNFLGYKKTDKGIEIDKEQEPIVKLIYSLFLTQGKSCHFIAEYLNENDIPTPSKKGKKWTTNNIVSILTNEKYYGDALLQKTYTVDYLEHKLAKNKGEVIQYYVSGSQPAIISKEEWDLVQFEINKRKEAGVNYSRNSIFAGKLICADCGGFYGKKIWHSNDEYRKEVYQCNHKFSKGKDKCKTPSLTEEQIKKMFLKALNIISNEKQLIIEDTELVKSLLTDTSKEEETILKAEEDMEVVSNLLEKEIEQNSRIALNHSEIQKKHESLVERYNKAKSAIEEAIKIKSEKKAKEVMIRDFIESLKKMDSPLIEWSDEVWLLMIDNAKVNRDKSISFLFKNGKEITIAG